MLDVEQPFAHREVIIREDDGVQRASRAENEPSFEDNGKLCKTVLINDASRLKSWTARHCSVVPESSRKATNQRRRSWTFPGSRCPSIKRFPPPTYSISSPFVDGADSERGTAYT
uniref:(northern house mosquito) hypothetical protein n=1 Tax=Culex pipiens TaxID=7175 RepID=A0A8D8FTD7_CULPI